MRDILEKAIERIKQVEGALDYHADAKVDLGFPEGSQQGWYYAGFSHGGRYVARLIRDILKGEKNGQPVA